MDLSWCIICDNRIDDGVIESSLYCSEKCKNTDQIHPTVLEQPSSSLLPSTFTTTTIPSSRSTPFLMKPSKSTTINTTLLRNKRSNITTNYPWEFFYNRPRNKRQMIVKRCQPLVSSSFTTATAFFTPKSSMA
ncbi:hypothetical protein BJ944DRAFT_269604 [Cunninghamella echinulata]|nr:hypothetical protein BJ944DRAFT_269604 [Cunninghamella echinulata]